MTREEIILSTIGARLDSLQEVLREQSVVSIALSFGRVDFRCHSSAQ
jgi:hypothetical protein